MSNCVNCGNHLKEGSLFCDKCGTKVISDVTLQKTKKISNKRLLIYGVVGLVIIVGAASLFFINNNPINKFKNAVEGNKYSDASTVYNQNIKGNTEKEKKTEEYIKEELAKINADFKSNKIDYQKANTRLETISKLDLLKSDVDHSISDLNKLNDSRTSFKKGQEFINNKNIKDAISEFKKVITEDENQAKAQELITSYSTEFKNTILKDSEQLSSNSDYDKAISLLNDGLSVLTNDSDISAKKASYEKLNVEKKAAERKKKMEETKVSQEVVAEKASIVVQDTNYKSLYPDMIQVIVRNNTDKTVKNMKVSNLAFDSNGLPIKIKREYSFSDASFEFVGSADNVNIVPKTTFGDRNGWNLDESHGIKTVLSCVKEVEYYDGSKWTNPYYDYWLQEYKEKPLK